MCLLLFHFFTNSNLILRNEFSIIFWDFLRIYLHFLCPYFVWAGALSGVSGCSGIFPRLGNRWTGRGKWPHRLSAWPRLGDQLSTWVLYLLRNSTNHVLAFDVCLWRLSLTFVPELSANQCTPFWRLSQSGTLSFFKIFDYTSLAAHQRSVMVNFGCTPFSLSFQRSRMIK